LRRRRFRLFKKIIAELKPPVKILDAGGTETFWEMMGLSDSDTVNVTVINTEEIAIRHQNFKFIQADTRRDG
jgi:hypothetical protein